MNSCDKLLYRLASFKDWPLNFPSAYSLADSGLFFSGRGDEVCCYKCLCYISNWKENDVPVERHKLASPNCPLVAPNSVTLPSFSSGPTSNAVNQLPIPNIRPEQESKPVQLSSPRQESLEMSISGVDVSRHGDSLVSENAIFCDSQNTHLKSEAVRLRTFVDWPHEHITPASLAKAGLFSMNVGDCVKCAFCNGLLKHWELDDLPFREHKRHYPHCRFVRGLSVGNVPIKPGTNRSYRDSQSISDDIFSDLNRRRSSFENRFHLLRNQNPEALADAGFYYVGPVDSVKCFCCDGVLRNWLLTDDPWIEHAKWFPHCNFLIEMKGCEFVETVARHQNPTEILIPSPLPVDHKEEWQPMPTREKSPPQSNEEFEHATNLKQVYVPSNASSSTNENHAVAAVSSHSAEASSTNLAEQLKIRDEALANTAKMEDRQSDILLCKICMDEMANTAFLPCGHLLCCEHCAPALSECPVCRGILKGTLKVYIS